MPIFVIKRALSSRLKPCLFLFAGLIVGCSSIAQPGKPEADTADRATATAAAQTAERDPLPSVDLTSGILYQIMAAEVAQQRGDTAAALATYLQLAHQTRDPRLARRATEIALSSRLTAEAMDSAKLWVDLAPKSTEAALALGTLQLANGRYDEARIFWTAQLKSSADPVDDLAGLQRLLARSPGNAEAFAFLDTLAAPYVDGTRAADAHLILASGAANAGLTDRAVREAGTAVRLDPDSERTNLIAAQTVARLDGKDKSDATSGRTEALKIVRDFLRRKPDAIDARLAAARLLIGLNRIPEAREQFDMVLQRDPGNADALYARGVLALDGKPPRDEARRYFERYLDALKAKPGSQPPDAAYMNLARIAEDERRYDEALNWLKQVEDDSDQYLAARVREAGILAKQKHLDAAMKLLQDEASQPQRTEEERSQLISAQAQLLRDAKRYQESYDLLSSALAKSPSDANLLYDTAMAAEKLDRMDVMEQHLRRLMELKPQDAHAYNALGYSLADRNQRLDEAQHLIAQALKLSPDDAYILDSMGWVLYRRGDLAGARGYLERAWKSRPEGEVGAHLGEVLWQSGEQDAARRVWRESIALDPENELVQATLARLKVKP